MPEFEHEIDEVLVDVEYTATEGCEASWGYSGGSPAEEATSEITNIKEIEKLIGRLLTKEEINELEEYALADANEEVLAGNPWEDE